MRVLIIRDDWCEGVGLGHVMRCRALAEALVEQDCSVTLRGDVPHPSEELGRYDVLVIDHYKVLEYGVAHAWLHALPTVVIDDFGKDYPGAALVIRPIGEHALIRRAVRDAKPTSLRCTVGTLDLRTRRDIPPDRLPMDMVKASKVICGAGLTALEARYLGVPCEYHVLAENQRRTAEFLDAGGQVDGLGAARVAKLIMGLVK